MSDKSSLDIIKEMTQKIIEATCKVAPEVKKDEIGEKTDKTIEKIDEKFYDDSVGRKTGESSNFHILKNSKGEAIIGKNFKKDDVNFMYGPALESRGRSWLTDKPFVQYTTIIWLPNALTPRHGIAIPLEEVIKAIEMDDEMLKEKLASIGLPVSLDEYNKQVLEFSK